MWDYRDINFILGRHYDKPHYFTHVCGQYKLFFIAVMINHLHFMGIYSRYNFLIVVIIDQAFYVGFYSILILLFDHGSRYHDNLCGIFISFLYDILCVRSFMW